jgi:hypothetical protein
MRRDNWKRKRKSAGSTQAIIFNVVQHCSQVFLDRGRN